MGLEERPRPIRELTRLKLSPTRATNEPMDKVIHQYSSFDALETEEYRDWQALPPHERMRAVAEITLATYHMKEPARNVRRLQRTLVHLQFPEG